MMVPYKKNWCLNRNKMGLRWFLNRTNLFQNRTKIGLRWFQTGNICLRTENKLSELVPKQRKCCKNRIIIGLSWSRTVKISLIKNRKDPKPYSRGVGLGLK